MRQGSAVTAIGTTLNFDHIVERGRRQSSSGVRVERAEDRKIPKLNGYRHAGGNVLKKRSLVVRLQRHPNDERPNHLVFEDRTGRDQPYL